MTVEVKAAEGGTSTRREPWEPLLRRMLEIRAFENEVKRLFGSGVVRGSTHLCQGQEAVVVGSCSVLEAGDTMTCSYRGHGAALAMGVGLAEAFGEILGRRWGLCGGKGGSMHFADFSRGVLGSNAIVGAQLPIAVGAAFASQYRGERSVSLCFLGDGATNIGAFHESLNLASIWKLPVIFVVENNHYGEYSPLESTTPITRLAERAASYGMPGVYVDGNDVFAVRQATTDAVELARGGDGPTLIEADTYRHEGHSRSDPAKYRPAGELETWLRRDPIAALEAVVETELAAPGQLGALRADVDRTVAEALETAKSWPPPPAEALTENVFT